MKQAKIINLKIQKTRTIAILQKIAYNIFYNYRGKKKVLFLIKVGCAGI